MLSNTNEKKNSLTIFSLAIANELCEKGFRYTEIKPDRRKPEHYIYYFPRTPEIEHAFEEILKKRGQYIEK